jgi:hypothetical protein
MAESSLGAQTSSGSIISNDYKLERLEGSHSPPSSFKYAEAPAPMKGVHFFSFIECSN